MELERFQNDNLIYLFIINMLSKDTTNNITNKIADASERAVGSRYKAGLIIATVHSIVVIAIVYLFFFSSTKTGVVIGVGGVLSIILLHIVFNGCILLRVERTLFNDKYWYNLFNIIIFPLKQIGIVLNKDIIYKIVSFVDVLLLYISYVKITTIYPTLVLL